MRDVQTIFIVDDNPIARETLSELLYAGPYRFRFAAGGRELLDTMDEALPDVILLDVMMPGMDGYAVCRELKQHPRWRHIPVILVTALDGREELIRGLDAGADEFLSKPVNGAELRARVRSMLRIKKQYDELQRSLRLRDELADMIVHDMRTPLATVLIYSELLLRRANLPETDGGYLSLIQAQARRLDSFINDILLVAKMEQGEMVLRTSEVELGTLLREVENNHRAVAEVADIRLAVEIPETSLCYELDTNLFSRVIDNLVSNAVKFSPAGSVVRIVLKPSGAGGAGPQVMVADEGPGVPPADRDAIFDKYHVVAVNRSGAAQHGLGLAFCKMVVEAHGGRIAVGDNAPHGALFTISLP